MTFHLFGNILTNYGSAANNRGENEGNITTLQKLLWHGEIHTMISAEAIRWALRYYWQTAEIDDEINRTWNDSTNGNDWEDKSFNAERFIDDDVLGYMDAKKAKEDESDIAEEEEVSTTQSKPKGKGRKANASSAPKGTATVRRGVLEVNRAVSLIPYAGDLTFNAASVGATSSASKGGKNPAPYATEVHATRYQYGFAMTPSRLVKQKRLIEVLEGLTSLSEVGGNHSRFLYDFSPDSIVLRWTHDFAARCLYCFEEDESGVISLPDLVRRVRAGDINPQELWIAGSIVDESEEIEELTQRGVNTFKGVKAGVADLSQQIQTDLGIRDVVRA
jgi:CRISPR-associated protein Cst2